MFCWQCEQTQGGTGCHLTAGACGKSAEAAGLQDVLIYTLKGLGAVARAARQKGLVDNQVDRFMLAGLFSTVTNVNFDTDRLVRLIHRAAELRDQFKVKAQLSGLLEAADFKPGATLAELSRQAESLGFKNLEDPNVLSLRETGLYGLKGLAAYADHASVLGQEDENLYAFVHEYMAATLDKTLGLDDWLKLVLRVGEMNLRAMELLDAGNTGTYGHPEFTRVPLGPKAGKAILITGHDLKDLAMLLRQTEGKSINIYTHGEMLPTHAYPELKKYKHFVGHYGTAWQNQQKELPHFPGPVLFTTNCIQKPSQTYHDHVLTTGLVAWPGMVHIEDGPNGEKDFGPLIQKALELPGFSADEDKGQVTVGFGRHTVLNVADKIIGVVKSGAIKHFFLVGGCDGAKPGRNYYTEFVEKAPEDTVILTLACGKFRFFDKDLGTIGGLPRLMDIGQCNDAYSAIQIALALAKAFNRGVNDLPLTLIISWYEQKACAILLTLLHLGIKNIHLGPSRPAFISPAVLDILVKNYDLKPISAPEADLEAALN